MAAQVERSMLCGTGEQELNLQHCSGWYAILRCHLSCLASHLGWLTFFADGHSLF